MLHGDFWFVVVVVFVVVSSNIDSFVASILLLTECSKRSMTVEETDMRSVHVRDAACVCECYAKLSV